MDESDLATEWSASRLEMYAAGRMALRAGQVRAMAREFGETGVRTAEAQSAGLSRARRP